LTISLVRILFPGIALLVLSAWCLGVLNSHRRFFLSYASPVLWNGALIATAVALGDRAATERGRFELATWLAWGAVVGSALQLLVQLPAVVRILRSVRPSLAVGSPGVRATVRAFGPILVGRGSVQVSAYVDTMLATYLTAPIVSAIGYAQLLYLLPVSLFGMSISASELTEMSRTTGSGDALAAHLRARLAPALRHVVFFVVPSAVAFLLIGRSIVALLYQSGRFGAGDTEAVWLILCGSAIGLSAGTQGRLVSSAFYALGDTRTPLRCALIRIFLTIAGGWALALPVRHHLGYAPVWGAVGLTGSAGIAAWLEFELLRRALARRIGGVPVPVALLGQIALCAGVAGALGVAVERWLLAGAPTAIRAGATIAVYAVVTLGLARALGIPEARTLLARLGRVASRARRRR
jgi:putative peptidoglycan lipid II flippase